MSPSAVSFCFLAGLLTILGIEWLPPASMATRLQPPQRPAPRVEHAERDIRSGTLAGGVQAILMRPVFFATRRPARTSASSSGRSPVLPRLSGIVIVQDDRRAIFGGDKPVVGRMGDTVGNYKIIGIRPASVILEGDSGMEVLQVGFSDRTAPASTASSAGTMAPNLIDKLNNDPPPSVALPGKASLIQMLSRLPKPRG